MLFNYFDKLLIDNLFYEIYLYLYYEHLKYIPKIF